MADPTPTSIQQNLPSPYIQGALTALSERLLPLLSTSAAIPTTTYAPQVAAETQLQQQARGLAGGLGDYQQYLNQAQQYSGPQAYQQFMSPYQQEVIGTTLTEFDKQRQQALAQQQAQAVAGGAFGGAREGVQRAEYGAQTLQDRILVAHRVTSPLLFGIRTQNNGFSSQSEEMKTAFSILQTMTIAPFQNILINSMDYILREGGYGGELELYFEQLTPLVILSQTAEETGQTVSQVEEDVNDSMENPATTEDETTTDVQEIKPDEPISAFNMMEFNTKEYEIYK